jgi:signal transduction histidine kinase
MTERFRVPAPPRVRPLVALLLALALPLVAYALQRQLRPLSELLPFGPFFLAVVLTAWAGGAWPAIVSEAASAALGYLFLSGSASPDLAAGATHGALGFLPIATVIAAIGVAARAGFRERERTAETLRAAEQRERARAEELQAVMDAVPTMVLFAHDPQARRVTGSRAAHELLRIPPGSNPSKTGERPPTHFRVFKGSRELPPHDLPTQVAARTGRAARDVELEVLFDDGTRRRILGNAEPLFDEAGRPRGAVAAFADVTRLTDALAARDAFLSMASHELKTPLTSLQLHVQGLLRRGALRDEGQARSATAIQRQVVRLTALVNTLLDVSRINEGRLDLTLEPVDLTAVAGEVAARLAAEAVVAAAPITVEGPAVVGRWDRLRVEQVITNLLSNALKYGAGEPVAVRVEAAGEAARLSVLDRGIGIAPEDQRRIFERFERGSATRGYGGLGLGLWIAREFATALGGRLTVESAGLGAGAAFHVELPLAGPPAAPP